jgi:hypothetical protein
VPEASPKPSPLPSPSPKPPNPEVGSKRRKPLFSEDEEETPRRPKKPKKATVVSEDDRSPSPTIEARSPSPEVPVVEPSSGKRRKGKGGSAVAGMDSIPQEITKHGYSEKAFLLNGLIYIGVSRPHSHIVRGF